MTDLELDGIRISARQMADGVERRRHMWMRAAKAAESFLAATHSEVVEEARVLLLQVPDLRMGEVEAVAILRRWPARSRQVMAVIRPHKVNPEPQLIRCDAVALSQDEAEERAFGLLVRLAIAIRLVERRREAAPDGDSMPFRFRDRVFDVPERVISARAAKAPPGLQGAESRKLYAGLLIARLRAELAEKPKAYWNLLPSDHQELLLDEMADLLNFGIREVDRVPVRGIFEPA